MRNPFFAVGLGIAATLVVASMLGGCSTPQHTNTLIFGTSTRFAIDASQEPTGALGVTIGYKRHEAVWMPLLANERSDAKLGPAACDEDDCRKFEGQAGTGGGAAGAGAKDTYSVIATFSGSTSAAAQSPQVKGSLAQYFATGLAARLLAQYGGAAVVNSGSLSTSSSAISADAKKIVDDKRRDVPLILAKLTKTTGEVDAAALDKLLNQSPASTLAAAIKARLKTMKTRSDLESELLDGPEKTAEALFATLDKL